jgi:hypothetical protein
VTEFEAILSMIDKHVSPLEKKVKSPNHIAHTQWFISRHVVNFCIFTLLERIFSRMLDGQVVVLLSGIGCYEVADT